MDDQLFDLAKRMADKLRDYGRNSDDADTLDLCCEFDVLDAQHDKDEWRHVHGPVEAQEGDLSMPSPKEVPHA
jgi:hypothetical protein